LLEVAGNDSPILIGLQEFREHLGGELTIMLLNQIGVGIEVHEMDAALIRKQVKC
jgi:3-dehydroquinate synthase